jgi:hypothetical protein
LVKKTTLKVEGFDNEYHETVNGATVASVDFRVRQYFCCDLRLGGIFKLLAMRKLLFRETTRWFGDFSVSYPFLMPSLFKGEGMEDLPVSRREGCYRKLCMEV